MNETGIYKIRPAGRHILTIGSELIQDKYAAIIELVKNSYDADSPGVTVAFSRFTDNKREVNIKIEIMDKGHGMSRDEVINKWLVPSTDDKLKRIKSKKGRILQGRKGIGRYAASILGEDLLMQTMTKDGQKTEIYLEWNKFSEAKYLDDVDILVNSESIAPGKSGTNIIITGKDEFNDYWNDKSNIDNLNYELKKMILPIEDYLSGGKIVQNSDNPDDSEIYNQFEIFIEFKNFYTEKDKNTRLKITPYPVFELYDYRIYGQINENGKGNVYYQNNKIRNSKTEIFDIDIILKSDAEYCGKLYIDLRVYDRESESIDELIKRGLKDEKGNYLGKLEARQLLNKYNGVSVYRNGFRLRPMGDPDFDWLELNSERVQDPSARIGTNQVIGFVLIEPEEKSHLEEKSARDGLKENNHFEGLKTITREVLRKLENRRFIFRKKTGLGRQNIKVEKEINKLFEFEDIKKKINNRLTQIENIGSAKEDVIKILDEKQAENNKIAEEIKKIVAVYQGQATLGKIVNVVLHEGRHPLNFFKNQITNIRYYVKELKENFNEQYLDKIIDILSSFEINSKMLVDLFAKIDHLAAKKRDSVKDFKIIDTIRKSFKVFDNILKTEKITVAINCPEDLIRKGWEQDFYIILTNLIDNSIYWLDYPKIKEKIIKIDVVARDNEISYIDYRDSGSGIEKNLIESEIIFEPGFSTKKNGTGLGLAIAGEAAERNGLKLKAFYSESGAYFRIENKGDESDE